jgi:hypothetical protein
MQKSTKFLLILAVAAPLFAALAISGLTAVFGAPSIGVRCSRLDGPARCEVHQSAFFGIVGNSVYSIPEAEISGARTERPVGGGGRRAGTYRLLLELRSGGYPYPVLSDQSFDTVEAAARRLNSYLADASATEIELRERLWLSALVPLVAVALGLLLGGVVALARRRRNAAAAGLPG